MRNFYIPCFLFILLASCSTTDKDSQIAAEAFKIAKEPFDEGNFETAITKLGEFKSRFPYSHFAADAELLIADSQFKLDHFIEALDSYSQFIRLHPKHPKADYAKFRIGECYWEDAPEEVDREQEFSALAIEEWQQLVRDHPQSSYSQKAKELIQIGQKRIAEADQFIYQFYCKQEIWHACAHRALKLIEKFPEYQEMTKEAKLTAARALENLVESAPKEDVDSNFFLKNMSRQEILAKAQELRTNTLP